MKIEIVTSAIPGGWHPKQLENFLGGNEETLVSFPRALSRAGYDVTVFTDLLGVDDFTENSATWTHRHKFDLEEIKECLITFKDRSPIFRGARANKLIHWSQDIESKWSDATLKQLDHFVTLGTFHAALMHWIPEEKLRISPLGMDFPKGDSAIQKDPNLMLYSSSPDRGLITVLEDWALIKKKFPELKLVVTYSWDNLDKWGGLGGQQLKARLMELLNQPDIQKAELTREQMTGLLEAATYYVFPLNRPASDLCGFGLQKAIHHGCKLVLNYVQDNGFQDIVKDFIPYRNFLKGSIQEHPNNKNLFSPRSWDQLIEEDWCPILGEA